MAVNRLEESARSDPGGAEKSGATTTPTAPAKGASAAWVAWMPLAVTILTMPLLAYATTTYWLVPHLRQGLGLTPGSATATARHATEKGGTDAEAEAAPAAPGDKPKVTVPLKEKILVNVAGSMGTRYLVVSATLVSRNPRLKELIEENEAQLRDLAGTTLGAKTISDLEKPGARNLIRTELITAFNNALGSGIVQEIYFTEFAVQ